MPKTLCNWCGQESNNDQLCDWCKRPLRGGAAAASRVDLEFLRDADESDKPGTLRFVAIAACVLACIALLAIVLRPQSGSAALPLPGSGGDADFASNPGRPRRERPPHVNLSKDKPIRDFIDVLGQVGKDRPRPTANKSDALPAGTTFPSVVKISKVELTMVATQDGGKQVMGMASLDNGSNRNVIDFRFEVAWGSQVYSMTPMVGTAGKLRRMDQRALRPGRHATVQLVSQPIHNDPGGAPYSLRLLAWLDGAPNNSFDEYILQLSR